MKMTDTIMLSRECDAVLIPDGTPIKLPQGTLVIMVQALGGSYTININGNLARIGPQDADALGFSVEAEARDAHQQTITGDGTVDEQLIWEKLRTCYDPEIPINIVELGLIYDCRITPLEAGNRVDITMTLTAPGCGMGEFLVMDIRDKIQYVQNVTEVNVDLTFEPPWNQTMMSEEARLQTGLY